MSRGQKQRQFQPPPEDVDYFQDKRYILYIRSGQKASQLALKVAAPIVNYHIKVEPVEELDINERPEWLKGTPTLVDLNQKKVFMGRAVLDELEAVIETDDGTGPRTACQPSPWLQNMERFSPDIEDDDEDESQFLNENRKINERDISRYSKLRSQTSASIPPPGSNKPLGKIEGIEDGMSGYYEDNMDKKVSQQDLMSYMQRRDNMPRRSGPPSQRSGSMAISDTNRRSVTDDRIQSYLERRQQVPQRKRIGGVDTRRQQPATKPKRRRL